MTKSEFCEKWQRGWQEVYLNGTAAYFYTQEQMLEDINRVIYSEVCGWKEFVDAECQKSVDLDEWQCQEAEAIQNRKTGGN